MSTKWDIWSTLKTDSVVFFRPIKLARTASFHKNTTLPVITNLLVNLHHLKGFLQKNNTPSGVLLFYKIPPSEFESLSTP